MLPLLDALQDDTVPLTYVHFYSSTALYFIDSLLALQTYLLFKVRRRDQRRSHLRYQNTFEIGRRFPQIP